MKSILRFVMTLLVIGVVIGQHQGAASAAIVNGYFTGAASNTSTTYFCEVLGQIWPGNPQTNCIVSGNSRQYDSELTGYAAACGGTSSVYSNCFKNRLTEYLGRLLDAPVLDTELQNTGAAYIVNTMRGANAGRSFTSGSGVFNDWRNRLYSPYVSLQIESMTFTKNTAFDRWTNDVIQYTDTAYTAPVLRFYVQNPVTGAWSAPYAIKLDCGNPVGDFQPLPPPPPAPVVNCGILNPVAEIEPGQTVNLSATVTYGNAPPGATINAYLYIRNIQTGVNTGVPINSIPSPPPGGGTFTLQATNPSMPIAVAGRYAVFWALSMSGVTGYDDTGPGECGGDFAAYNFFVMPHPYFQVDNGDVLAGTAFSTVNNAGTKFPCPAGNIPSAGIAAYSNTAGTLGAGTDYAAFALGRIQEFGTTQKNNVAGNPPPSTLSFSNETAYVNQGAGLFGGMFGSIKNCVDYWGRIPAVGSMNAVSANSTNVTSMVTGKYYKSGNIELTGGNINPGQHVTLYVDGNVRISGNITYAAPASWSSRDKIPSFKLIVRGSIYIEDRVGGAGVNQLDGIYVAIPDSNYVTAANNTTANIQRGTISTCGRPGAFATYTPADLVAVASRCTQRLTVIGGFAANQMFLLRRGGSESIPNSAAEVFDYSPEVWMAMDPDATTIETYDSIMGLPPVL